ncbi:sensor histidine kinase [Gorillibacterium massiliense]|uniref:sensor histidine kinase n=1 Tax=Gorillibacterium massiliense TaxID=1280390 RepID=UPI001EE235A1|nr:HAMP domain-containing sensor histidine kinase [Gorillibacterium massiliense]
MAVLIVLIYQYNHSSASHWLLLMLIAALVGMVGNAAYSMLPPNLNTGSPWASLYAIADILLTKFYWFSSAGVYFFFMYAIVYSGRFNRKLQYGLGFLLPLPYFVLYSEDRTPGYYQGFLISVMIYTLLATALMIDGAWRETHPGKRRERLLSAILLIPPVWVAVVFRSLFPEYERDHYQSFVAAPVVFVVLFIFLSFRYGVLDIRITLRKTGPDERFKGIASGLMMMNHAVKNHVTNIHLIAQEWDHARTGFPAGDAAIIQEESQQVMAIVKRIRNQIEDIEIERAPCDLNVLLENALRSLRRYLDNGVITVVKQWDTPATYANCDKDHIQEVFYNILHNAIEAIGDRPGTIQIRIEENRKMILIEISDDGPGIDRNDLTDIFNPFFSTKADAQHFGLGLSYCYLVMEKHGGSIEAFSIKDMGTTFTVRLPVKGTPTL